MSWTNNNQRSVSTLKWNMFSPKLPLFRATERKARYAWLYSHRAPKWVIASQSSGCNDWIACSGPWGSIKEYWGEGAAHQSWPLEDWAREEGYGRSAKGLWCWESSLDGYFPGKSKSRQLNASHQAQGWNFTDSAPSWSIWGAEAGSWELAGAIQWRARSWEVAEN